METIKTIHELEEFVDTHQNCLVPITKDLAESFENALAMPYHCREANMPYQFATIFMRASKLQECMMIKNITYIVEGGN